MRRAALLIALLSLAAGCIVPGVPTQQQPSCSWSSQPPDNADQLCRQIFRTLSLVARAEVRHDDSTVRRLVTQPAAAARIIAYGAQLSRQKVRSFHVVPSMTLLDTGGGRVGAAFFLQGQTSQGRLRAQETVYLRQRHGTQVIIADQPGHEW